MAAPEALAHPTHLVEVHVGPLLVRIDDTDDPLLAALEATVRVKGALAGVGVDDPHVMHRATWVAGRCRFCDQPAREGEDDAETCYAHCQHDPQGEGNHNADFRREQEDSFATQDGDGKQVFDLHVECEYCGQLAVVSLPVEPGDLAWDVARDAYGSPLGDVDDAPPHAHAADYDDGMVRTTLDSYSNARTTVAFPCTADDCPCVGTAVRAFHCFDLEW